MLPRFVLFGFEFYSYPLILGMVWGVTWQLGLYLLHIKKIKINFYPLYFIGCFIFAWLGAKVLFLLTLNNELVSIASKSSSFWLGGGFVFYGGLIFGIIFTLIYARIFKIPIKDFSFALPLLALGHSVGRIACLLAGCCFGHETNLPWGIELHGALRHPVQIYEALGLFILFYLSYKKYLSGKALIIFYLGSYSVLRIISELFRGDKLRGEDILMGLSTSQLISFGFLIVLSAIYLRSRNAK